MEELIPKACYKQSLHIKGVRRLLNTAYLLESVQVSHSSSLFFYYGEVVFHGVRKSGITE